MTRILSVMYVDDEPDLLEIGKLFLEQSGEYAIDTSISAADALIRLEQKKYDAIVSDYQMPEMDGIKFLQVLRNRGDQIPFIIFTGRGREEVIIEALNSGVDFYLQKGGEPKAQFAELINIVGKAVRQKSADEALKESEAKYRNILTNIQDVYYRSDVDGNLILASPSMATVLGYDSLSELYGKNISRTFYYNPEQRKQFLADINRSGSVTNYEVTLKKRDGTPVFVLTSSHKYYDQSGNFLGVEGIFRDITERKKAEDELRAAYEQVTAFDEEMQAQFNELKYGQEALRTSEKKLQGIVHGSPIPQFVIDKNHQVISWNSALERYSGVKGDEVLGTNQQWKAFYPKERPCMADLLVDGTIDKIPDWYLGKYNKSKYVEEAYEATDFFPKMGTNGIWLYFTASTIRDSQGNIIGAVETLEDITEITIKEKALKASEEQYRNVVEIQTEFICRFRPDGTHVFANEAYCRYFGKKCSELIGKKFRPEIHPDDQGRLREHFLSFTQENPVSTIDHRIIMPDGSLHWQRWVDRAIFDEQGNLIEYQTVGRDITDIKQAEEALRESENKLHAVLRGSPIPQFVIDRDHRIIHWNLALEEYSGIRRDEVLGTKQQWRAFYPEERPCMADLLVEGQIEKIPQWYSGKYTKSPLIENAYEATDFFPHMGKAGTWLHFTAAPIRDSEGNVIGAVETLEDVTERKKAEDKLRAAYEQLTAFDEEMQAQFDELKYGQEALRTSEKKLQGIVHGSPIPQFVIDKNHQVISWNSALERYSGVKADEVLGTNQQWKAFYPEERPCMADLLVDGTIDKIPDWYLGKYNKSKYVEEAYEATDFFPNMGTNGIWLYFTASTLKDSQGNIIGAVETLEDITGIIAKEEALKASEEQYRNVVETQTEFVCRFRPDGTHVFANEAYCRYFGKDCLELIGKKFQPEIHPDDRGRLREHFLSFTQENPVATIDHRIIMPDGSLHWQRWVDRAIFDEQGNLFEYQTVGRDITDIKQAEEALRESENKLHAVLRGSPIPQFVIDRDHRIIHWNQALEKYSGIRRDEVLGTKQQWRAFYPQERPCMADLLVEGQIEKIPQWYSGKYTKSPLIENAFEATDFFPHMGKTGTWLHFTGAPITDSEGNIIGAVETLEDVTAWKQAQEEIREMSEFQQSVISNANVLLMVLDNKGTIRVWNTAAEEISGYSAGEVINNNGIWKLLYPDKDYRKTITRILLHIIEERKYLENFETRIRTKSGEHKTILWNTRRLDKTAGQSSTFVAIGVDITKSILAEQALRDSENKLNAIVRSSPIPQFVINRNHMVIHWNTALERYSGIKAEDVIGTNQQWKAFYPSERPCMADLLVEGEREKIPQWYEGKYAKSTLNEDAYEATDFFPHMGPSGIWLYFTAAPIRNFSEQIIGAVETLEDITERKHTEDALKQINKKLNLMSSVTRHDILNQLTALAGYLDLLKRRLSEHTDLEYIVHGESALKNIEQQILFTRDYQEIGSQRPEWQKISTIIRQAVDQLDHGSVTVEISVEDYDVFADRLLVKVFYNLIDNSLRYGGKNTIIRFYNRNPADELVLICEDDGVGIQDNEKERIFERGVGRHSGFGLFLAQEILSITGLTIRETGKPGNGARFEILIPRGKYRQSLTARDNLET